MYVVLEVAGKQFRVKENEYIYVPKLDSEVSSSVDMTNVLLFSDGSSVTVGNPNVGGIQVQAKVIDHLKDDKVIVFKKKRRKGYKKKQGHRQMYTKVLIEKILNNNN